MKLGSETTEVTSEFLNENQFIEAKAHLDKLEPKLALLENHNLQQCTNCSLVGIPDLWFPKSKNPASSPIFLKKCKLCSKK